MKNIKRIKFQSCKFENDCFDILDIDSEYLESIEELRIQDCYIRDLGSLENLKSLKVLDIYRHSLLNIPTSIIESVKLVELRVRWFIDSRGRHRLYNINTQFRNIEDITKLVNLETLSLSDNEFECIPKAITKMVNLKKLVLKGNRISTIDGNINKLVNLEELILNNNRTFKLPTNTKINLPNLKYLSMVNCGLPSTRKDEGSDGSSSVSDNSMFYSNLLENLPKLERLDLSWNRYMDLLPPEILKMGNLKYLYAKANGIGSDSKKGLFGSVIEGDEPLLTSLKRLALDGNNMQVFPFDIFRIRALEELSMSGCKLKEIPGEIRSLKSIKILRLSGNELEALPSEIGSLRKLEHLDLLRNNLKVLPSELGDLRKLEYLNLSENKHLFTPDNINTILNIGSLKRLEMRNCGLNGRLSEKIGNLVNLRVLNLSSSFGLILPDEISKLKELREFYLEDIEMPTKNEIVDSEYLLLPREPLELPNLRLLSLYRSKLSRLPSIICKLKSLNTLHIDFTGIKELPKSFSNLENLQELSMSGNEIEEIPEEIFNTSTLESLDLSNNNITDVSSNILKLSKLRTLDIEAEKLKIYLPENIVFLLSLEMVFCSGDIRKGNSSDYISFFEWLCGHIPNLSNPR